MDPDAHDSPPPIATPSALDARFGVPGDARTALAQAYATDAAFGDEPSFERDAWSSIEALDAHDGFGTRRAARAVLRRASDGRFLIFRYPFRDGSFRFVVPGGGAEDGETPLAALLREVFEETGAVPRELRFSGLVLFHLLASTIHDDDRVPTVQYSPVFLGTIEDELPDTGGREAHWFTVDELAAQPRRPISDALVEVLRADDRGEEIHPRAVWLPA